jgi:hypothetical protein
LIAVVGALLAVPSCREPTQVQLIVRTTTACSELSGVIIDVGADPATVEQRATSQNKNESWRAQTPEAQCDPKTGEIGRIFLAPGSGTAAVLVRAGNKTDPSKCLAPDYKGCIVARRRISYVPRTTLTLTVNLDLSCVNVPCGVLSTCDQGRCIDSNATLCENDNCNLDPDASVPADERDAAVDAPAPVDAGVDAPIDAPQDVGFDAPVLDEQPGPGPGLTTKVSHTCARVPSGGWKCWGFNGGGQLGVGDTNDRGRSKAGLGAALPEVDFGPGLVALDVVAGGKHNCARLVGGQVKCWGDNEYGQLGLGDTFSRGGDRNQMGAALPTVDLGGRLAVQLALGFEHSCARLDDGTVKCWGQNNRGQLGLGGLPDGGKSPQQVSLPTTPVDLGAGRAVQVVAGYNHTCARLNSGAVRCWGAGGAQLGLGDGTDRGATGDAPMPLVDLDGERAVDLWASSYQTCTRLAGGAVKCWGINASRQLGLGVDRTDRGGAPNQMGPALPALKFVGGFVVTDMAIGSAHACARGDAGGLLCWGSDSHGQLGLGRGAPNGSEGVELSLASNVNLGVEAANILVAGYEHTCVLLSSGKVACWGDNQLGQLGIGTEESSRGWPAAHMGAGLLPVLLQ